MNQLAFRTALNGAIENHGLNITSTPGLNTILYPQSAANSSTNQTLHGIQVNNIQLFESELVYLRIAMGIMVITVVSVMSIFNGFWELGRPESLAQVEIARAFGAPMLARREGMSM